MQWGRAPGGNEATSVPLTIRTRAREFEIILRRRGVSDQRLSLQARELASTPPISCRQLPGDAFAVTARA